LRHTAGGVGSAQADAEACGGACAVATLEGDGGADDLIDGFMERAIDWSGRRV
jgi:hypothetical protein